MRKIVVSFLGRDCPGVLHSLADLLCKLDSNIEEITQTILQTEFAMIVIASFPQEMGLDEVRGKLESGLASYDMSFTLREFGADAASPVPEAEPFVVTLIGMDRKGIIAGVSGVLAQYGVNIENLKALPRTADSERMIIGFEISLPVAVDVAEIRAALAAEAERLGLSVTLQHRDIFEAMHRVEPL